MFPSLSLSLSHFLHPSPISNIRCRIMLSPRHCNVLQEALAFSIHVMNQRKNGKGFCVKKQGAEMRVCCPGDGLVTDLPTSRRVRPAGY